MIRLLRNSGLEPEDSALLYPSLGNLLPDGEHWQISVQGMIFRPGRLTLAKKLMLGLLRRAIRATREELASPLFEHRVKGFLVDALRGRKPAAKIGDQVYPLASRSSPTGLFHDDVRIPERDLNPADPASAAGLRVPVQLVTSGGVEIGATGDVLCLPSQGISVISDIDDTIKDTAVHCRGSMLANTFLHEFRPIPGMASTYRQWEAAGAAFHYVSSCPWQLFGPLEEYFRSQQLPPGSMHLRSFRLRDHLLRRLLWGRRPAKGIIMKHILERFPRRKFILVGDSGEYDPEIYGTLARRFPQQVAAIFIRRVPHSRTTGPRWQRAFDGVPQDLWRLFETPEELAIPESARDPVVTSVSEKA